VNEVVFLYILLAALFTEGMTELIVKSSIFSRVRENLIKESAFFKKLLSCGYCASVWAATLPAAFLVWCLEVRVCVAPISFLFLTVVVHRLSNYLHNINDKYFDKFYSSKER
jgi:hypothetical protein